MEQIAALEERMSVERMEQRLKDVNTAVQNQLSDVQHHLNFNLQKAYFKCSHDCFDRSGEMERISACVDHCHLPLAKAQALVQNEVIRLQERLNRALVVCQDKFEAEKVRGGGGGDCRNKMESCVEQVVNDNPHLSPSYCFQLEINFVHATTTTISLVRFPSFTNSFFSSP